MCFQWHLSISNQNPHHTMIGTFLLSASVLSNIQDSNNYHRGVHMPFLCLLSRFNSCEGFRWGIFPIQTIWDSWSARKGVSRVSKWISYWAVYGIYPPTSSLRISCYFVATMSCFTLCTNWPCVGEQVFSCDLVVNQSSYRSKVVVLVWGEFQRVPASTSPLFSAT